MLKYTLPNIVMFDKYKNKINKMSVGRNIGHRNCDMFRRFTGFDLVRNGKAA